MGYSSQNVYQTTRKIIKDKMPGTSSKSDFIRKDLKVFKDIGDVT